MSTNLHKLWIICFIGLSVVIDCMGSENVAATQPTAFRTSTNTSSPGHSPTFWLQHMKLLRQTVKDCVKIKYSVWHCLKQQVMNLVTKVLSAPVIELSDGIRFVRILNESTTNSNSNLASIGKDFKYLSWLDRLIAIFVRTLQTHKLQINLRELADAYMHEDKTDNPDNLTNRTDTGDVGEGRMRRHRYNMLITMMFGATALGAILVPMGFQLLSIVSGKALLMAKMALLLASINGLKRVANSGVHYGLYHVPGEPFASYYDRGDVHHPRNVPPGLAIAQPIDVGIRK